MPADGMFFFSVHPKYMFYHPQMQSITYYTCLQTCGNKTVTWWSLNIKEGNVGMALDCLCRKIMLFFLFLSFFNPSMLWYSNGKGTLVGSHHSNTCSQWQHSRSSSEPTRAMHYHASPLEGSTIVGNILHKRQLPHNGTYSWQVTTQKLVGHMRWKLPLSTSKLYWPMIRFLLLQW